MAGTLVRRVLLQIDADDGTTAEKLDRIQKKADELKAASPDLAVRIDTAAASAKLGVLRQELKDTAAGADGFGAATDRVSSASARMAEALAEQSAAAEKLATLQGDDTATAEALSEATAALTETSLAAAAARKGLADAEARVRAMTEAASAEQAEAGIATKSLTAETAILGDAQAAAGDKAEESAGKTEALGKAWDVAKYALLGVAGGLAYGIVKAAGFSQEMTRVHTQAGVATSQIKGLSAGILNMAGPVGQAPDALAESLYHVESSFASVGITGPKALSMVKAAAEEADVGGSNLVDTTNALDATIAAGVPGITSYGSAMGALNSIVGSGDMAMQDLTDAMGTGAMAVAKSYGQSIYQVGAALAVLGDNNIRGAKAATALRMAWQAVQAPLVAAKPILSSIGLGMTTLASTMEHHGLSAAIGQFIQHLKASKVPAADWGQYMTEIFGKKAGVAIGVLTDQFSRLQGKFPVLEKGAKDFGAAWATQSKTPQQELKDLEAGSEALATKLGTDLLPEAEKVLGWADSFVSALEKGNGWAVTFAGTVGGILALIALKKLEDGLTGAVEGVEGLWKGGGKLLTWGGKMVTMLRGQAAAQGEATVATEEGTVAQGEADAAMDANPIGAVILALAALGVGIYELVKHWHVLSHDTAAAFDVVRHAVADAGHDVSAWFDRLRSLAADLGHDFSHTFDDIRHDVAQWADDVRHDGDRVISFFEALPGRILHEGERFGTLLTGAGESLVMGLVHGIEDEAGAALHAVEGLGSDVIGAAKSVLKSLSPSRVFYEIGGDVTAGMAIGITETKQQAIDESRRLSQEVTDAAMSGEITAAEADSLGARITAALTAREGKLGRAMQEMGLKMKAGLLGGLENAATGAEAKSAVDKLSTVVMEAWSAGDVTTGKASGMLTWIQDDNWKLQKLATERQTIAATIKKADAYATSVTTATESAYGISQAAGGGTTPLSEGEIIVSLKQDVTQIRQFKNNIAKLGRMGLSKAYIDQLIQAGPASGGPIAAELAAGSWAQIRQINAQESQIASVSVSLGQTAADAMYDSGKDAGKGLLSGLQSQQKAITKEMDAIAKSMVAELRKELGIHSPSTVLRDHGRMAGAGLVLGLDDSLAKVTAAASRMAKAAIPAGYGSSAAGGPGRPGGGAPLQLEWVGTSADQALITLLKQHIRIRGGDPAVLGR